MASPLLDVTEATALKTPPTYIFRCLEIEEGVSAYPLKPESRKHQSDSR
jgi:hypothetical protein